MNNKFVNDLFKVAQKFKRSKVQTDQFNLCVLSTLRVKNEKTIPVSVCPLRYFFETSTFL